MYISLIVCTLLDILNNVTFLYMAIEVVIFKFCYSLVYDIVCTLLEKS